jgi:hypothetical protein
MAVASRVYIHESQPPFKRVCELTTATAIKRGWRMHDIVDGSFSVARTDPAFTTFGQGPLLALGNRVVIESPYLPSWVGSIQKPLWTLGNPTVDVQVKSVVRILAERLTPKGFNVSGSSGGIFRRLFVEVELRNPMYIYPCAAPEPGPTLSLELSSVKLFDALNTLADNAGMEWWLEPVVSPAGIAFTVYWSSQKGSDKSGEIVLRDGERGNLLDGSYCQDDANIATAVRVVGGSAGAGGFAVRPSALASFITSKGQLGQDETTVPDTIAPVTTEQRSRIEHYLNPATSREVQVVRGTTTDESTLAARASNSLDRQYRGPEEMSAVIAITDPLLPAIALGDVIRIEAQDLGPDGISKAFRVSEIAPDDEKVTLRGRADGGLLKPVGIVGIVKDMQADVRDLQRV